MPVLNREESLFLRLSETGRLIRMSRSRLTKACQEGAIPSVLIAGQWRIPRAAINQFLADAMNRAAEVKVQPTLESLTE
jgi:hypothetical protein